MQQRELKRMSINAKSRKQQVQATTSDDYYPETDPQYLADRCDIPIDYNDLLLNPGTPIVADDLPSDSYQWGVILLAASKMSVDNNTVMMRGHAHYDKNNGLVGTSSFVTSVALPESVRITAGSSATARHNNVTNNITMYPSFEFETIPYTAVGITTIASMWIGDNGVADISDNIIVVSSPFTVWGMNSISISGTEDAEPVDTIEVRSRKMKVLASSTPTTYPSLNMPDYSDFDQSLTTTVTVVGCNSTYNINSNRIHVSGIVGTGGIALSPSKIGVSTGGVLAIAMNAIQPVWMDDIPEYLEEPIPEVPTAYPTPSTTTTTTSPPVKSVSARDFKAKEVDQSNYWFSIGIAVGGNPSGGSEDTFDDIIFEEIVDLRRSMKQQGTTNGEPSEPTSTTKALYNGIINVSNNNIHLSRHTDPTIAGSEGGVLCVGGMWLRSTSHVLIETNTIKMENEIITDISMFDDEDVPAIISYGVRLASLGMSLIFEDVIEFEKRGMRAQKSEEGDPDWTCMTEGATTTISQNSSVSISHNHIEGMVSTDIYNDGNRAMFSVDFEDSILVYDASTFSIENNVMSNTGGVFATFLDLTTSGFASCGQGSISFSNNVLVSAPLVSNPYAYEDYWAMHLSDGLILAAFEGRFSVDNNSITFAATGAGVTGVEVGNGIRLSAYAEAADNSLLSIQGNTVMVGDTYGEQGGIQIELNYYGFTQTNGSSVRIAYNNVSMGCTQCRAIGVTVDVDGGIIYTDKWEINDNIVDVRAPQDPVSLDMANMMYGSGGIPLPPMEFLKRPFSAQISSFSSGNLIYFDKGYDDIPFAQVISVQINNNMITTPATSATSQFEETSAIYLNMLVPQGTFEVKGNTIKMGIAGTTSVTGITVVGASGSIGSNPDMTIYISNFTTIDVSGNTVDVMNGQPTAIVVAPNPDQSLALGNSSVTVADNTATITCDSIMCVALSFTSGNTNFTLYNSTFKIARNTLVFNSSSMGSPVAILGGPLTLDMSTIALDYNHFVFTPDVADVMRSEPHPDVYDAMTDSYRPAESPHMTAICNTLQGVNIVDYDLTSGINVGMSFNETSACPSPTPTTSHHHSKTVTSHMPRTTTRTLPVNQPPRTISKTRTLELPTTTTTLAPNTTNTTTTTATSATTSTTSALAASSMPTSASTTMTSAPTSAATSAPSTTMASTTASTTTTTTTTTTTVAPATTTTVAPATCNTALAAQLAAEMPLFADFTVSMSDVQRGLVRTVTTLSTLNTSYSLLVGGLLASDGGRLRLRTVQMSIAGNTDGFSSQMPTATLTFVNATTATINITALPSYEIAEDEALELSVETVELVGSVCTGTRLAAGRITVDAEVKLYDAPSSIATTVISGGAAAAGMGGMSGMAAEQQALSALVMYSCSDPHSRGAFGSYRALSPFAIFESYAGVVLGNAIVMAVVAIIQAVVLGVMRVCRRVRRQVELMAAARFPSILMNVSFAFHTGTVYAASQLISLPDQFESWEVAVGAIAFTYCVLYPIFLCVHPYYRIGRAYQEYEMAEWLATKKWPSWIVHIVPQGAMYSPETRRAYGSYVSSYRAPASQVWWTSYPTWTSIIIGLGGLFHPDTVPKCQALFIVLGLMFLAIGALCAWRAPLRSTTATYLNATAKVLTALILFCLASSVSQSGSKHASNAVFAFGIIQTVVTIIRILHSLLCSYFDNKMAKDLVPLSTTWTHVLGGNKKSTTQFATLDGLDLEDEASARDTSGDALLEMDDLKHEDIVLEAPKSKKERNPDSSSSSIADFSDKRSQSSSVANPPTLPAKDTAAAPQLASSTSQSSTTAKPTPKPPAVDNLSISDSNNNTSTSRSNNSFSAASGPPPANNQVNISPSRSSSSSSSLSLSEDDML